MRRAWKTRVAGWIRQLVARESEVEEDAIDLREPGGGGDRAHLAEVRLAKDDTVAESRESLSCSGDGRPVRVEPDQAAIRRGSLQDPLGMPTATNGRVDLEAARHW